MKLNAGHLWNLLYTRHKTQTIMQWSKIGAHGKKENFFVKLNFVPGNSVRNSANMIRGCNSYKLKDKDDTSLRLEARTAPH